MANVSKINGYDLKDKEGRELLTDEVSARISEDNRLENEILNEVNSRTNDYANLQNQIANESTIRSNGYANLQNQITNLASGSPLVADSVSEMIDTDRVYVNTTDGKWYYYDGDNWVIGGTYQSSGISDNSVTYDNLEDKVKETFEIVENPTLDEEITNGLVNSDGTITTSTRLGYYEISVIPNDVYKLYIYYNDYSNSNVTWLFKDINDDVVSYKTKADVIIGEDLHYTAIVKVPSDAVKMLINTKIPDTLGYADYINKIEKYQIVDIHKEQLDSKLKSLINENYDSEITPTLFIDESYLTETRPQEYESTEVLSISVNPGEKYKITAKQVAKNPLLLFTTNNAYANFTVNNDSYKIYNRVEYIKSSTGNYQFVDYEFTVPTYCNKIYINHWKNDSSLKIYKSTSYILNDNKMGFNKLIAIGDSITEVNYRALKNYLSYIKEDLSNLTIQNLGRSGTGYKNPGQVNSTFISRISEISNYDIENDIIIVMGSVNDISYVNDNLGVLGDTTIDTLYGSMYQFFNTLFSNFNGVRIGCISPINWKNSDTDTRLSLYLKALEDTCNLFNIPYLDISNKTNLRPNESTFLNEYYKADGIGNAEEIDASGVHPNSKGHKLIYGRIKEFIKKL